MPVMSRPSSTSSNDSMMSVPVWSGSLVLRMLSGMFFSRTGNTVPSCSTCAPTKLSSRSSLYVMRSIGSGSGTMRGRMPDTSVQFSYTSALSAAAASAPVMSLPPREKVRILPSGVTP